jgi:DHA2 family multidrug resistance protein-like MFS transporter
MMGLLFALPLQAQTVAGLDAEGSGLRLLPLIGGLLLTALPSGSLAQRVGTGPVIAAGLAVLAAGLAWGATTGLGDGGGFSAAWTAVCGAGIGLSLPSSMDAALGTLVTDAAGTGSAVLQAMRMVGSSFGAAIMGAVLNSGYRSALPVDDASLAGLPGSVVASVRDSVVAAVHVAHVRGSDALLHAARSAFLDGFDLMLLVAAALAALAAVVAVRLMAGQHRPSEEDEAGSPHELHPTG